MLLLPFLQLREHSLERLSNLLRLHKQLVAKLGFESRYDSKVDSLPSRHCFPEPKMNHTTTKDCDSFHYCSAKIYFPLHPIDIGLNHVIGFGQWNASGHDMSGALKNMAAWFGLTLVLMLFTTIRIYPGQCQLKRTSPSQINQTAVDLQTCDQEIMTEIFLNLMATINQQVQEAQKTPTTRYTSLGLKRNGEGLQKAKGETEGKSQGGCVSVFSQPPEGQQH